MNPPVDNSSCDPPCLMPKSFCSEVSSSLVSSGQFNWKKKEIKRKSHRGIFGVQTEMHNKNGVNRIKTIKRDKPESTCPLMNGSLCTHCDTPLTELNLNAAGNEMMAA